MVCDNPIDALQRILFPHDREHFLQFPSFDLSGNRNPKKHKKPVSRDLFVSQIPNTMFR
jgi:hypothetical protein